MMIRSLALAVVILALEWIAAAAAEATVPGDTSDAAHGLNLAGITLTPLYEADFEQPLRLLTEAELLDDARRAREPDNVDWVLEGHASARVENGRLLLTNDDGHLVCWNTRLFPADFLLEFGVAPIDANQGLNIVFFAAAGRDGGSIFDLGQPPREGDFKNYHSGGLNAYHVSYWATDRSGQPRATAHVRKNHGFHLVAQGRDFITGSGSGPHRVRVLKLGGQIVCEVDGKISVRWTDDGNTYGPVLGEGRIGLRQMVYTKQCSYTHFKVWAAAVEASVAPK